ncbi:MAG: response regulator [Candidatus Omnitrophica bacterium]|nr:response regulator [Candidatus Omnitrophota bacterium]
MDRTTRKILIVDDKAVNRQLLRAILFVADPGYIISEADSGQAALEAVSSEQPDIILLDVVMPGMDGYEVCEKLKLDIRTSLIPILFITSLDKTEDMVKCFAVGAADYIMKPINPEEIKARVRTHLRIRTAELERLESERIMTVNDMVATYNHNMNQPLMVVYTYLNLLLACAEGNDKMIKTCQKIRVELDKMNMILREIRSIQTPERTGYVGDSGMFKLDHEGDGSA